MPKFRKKPVVIEAIQFNYSKEGIEIAKEFCGDSLKSYGCDRCMGAIGWAHIGTLEDGSNGQAKHVASHGDWIIKGIKGEFYPCKQDIFELTYEPA